MPDLTPSILSASCDRLLNAGTADAVVAIVNTTLQLAGYPVDKLPEPKRWPVDADGNLVLGYDRLAAFLQLAIARHQDLVDTDDQVADDQVVATEETATVTQLRERLHAAEQRASAQAEALPLLVSFMAATTGWLARFPGCLKLGNAADLHLQAKLISSHPVVKSMLCDLLNAAQDMATMTADRLAAEQAWLDTLADSPRLGVETCEACGSHADVVASSFERNRVALRCPVCGMTSRPAFQRKANG